MGEFLEHLDLSQVPHGLLLDQSFQIADLSLFDGTQDSVFATPGLLREIYSISSDFSTKTGSINLHFCLIFPF